MAVVPAMMEHALQLIYPVVTVVDLPVLLEFTVFRLQQMLAVAPHLQVVRAGSLMPHLLPVPLEQQGQVVMLVMVLVVVVAVATLAAAGDAGWVAVAALPIPFRRQQQLPILKVTIVPGTAL